MLISSANNGLSGAHYLIKGLSLIQQKGLRRFVIMPIIANFILFAGAFYYLFTHLSDWLAPFEEWLPSWLEWLTFLLWPLAVISIFIVFTLLFSSIANFIAAPFNGLLAEKVELKLTGQPLNNSNVKELLQDIPRVFTRELHKLAYSLPKTLVLLMLFIVPIVGPVLWFIFGSWMMSLQYVDLAFDNHKISFSQMLRQLKTDRTRNLGFGSLVLLCSSIPLVNLIIMPIAVCGATAMYVDHYLTSSNKV